MWGQCIPRVRTVMTFMGHLLCARHHGQGSGTWPLIFPETMRTGAHVSIVQVGQGLERPSDWSVVPGPHGQSQGVLLPTQACTSVLPGGQS